MTRSCCSCCGCLSLRAMGMFVAFIAVFVTVINPALNYLSDQLDDSKPMVEEQQKPFDPSVTDVLGYKRMNFAERTEENPDLYLGITFLMVQSFPRWMTKLANWYDPTKVGDKVVDEKDYENSKHEPKEVDILDARKNAGTFAERGFTLIDMEGSPSIRGVENWRSPLDVKAFQDELEPRLFELYPNASRIEYTYSVVRGGSTFGDQPAAIDGPHLDYSQNDTAREEFHEIYPATPIMKEANALLGNLAGPKEEMKVLLGIWKPIMMETPVCDNPLAVMDARTFKEDQESPQFLHINFFGFQFHNLNGVIHYHEDQEWYYYPFQNESEVLVFTQYSKGKHFANPHGSFENPNCPDDSDKRVSLEMRAAVFFPK